MDLNNTDDSSSVHQKHESSQSYKTLKKRRFRQLERQNFGEDLIEPISSVDTSSKETHKHKKDKKSLKLNEKILKKASATVDLISYNVTSKKLINETISASFVTNVIELTKDALQALQKEE